MAQRKKIEDENMDVSRKWRQDMKKLNKTIKFRLIAIASMIGLLLIASILGIIARKFDNIMCMDICAVILLVVLVGAIAFIVYVLIEPCLGTKKRKSKWIKTMQKVYSGVLMS